MRDQLDFRKLALASAALIPLEFSIAARAADPPGAAESKPELEEIIVTVTRRSELASHVSESVSAFSAAKMEVLNIKSFEDIARFTPGVEFDKGTNNIAIRGIKSDAGSATTGVYIDDTPIQLRSLGPNTNSPLPYVFDLERVEVARGPQGTLFGAGSEGGTVRYITRQPDLSDFSAIAQSEFSGTAGGEPSLESGVAVGGPIVSDKVAFRVSGWARRDGGWIDRFDPYSGQITDRNANRDNTYVVRGAMTFAPIDNLTITPTYNFEQRAAKNDNTLWVGLSALDNGKFINGTPERIQDNDRFDLASLKIKYDLDEVDIISDTAYFKRAERLSGYSATITNLAVFEQSTSSGTDPLGNACANSCERYSVLLDPARINLRGFGRYVSQNFIVNRQSNVTQEVRAQSSDKDARLTWVAGIFYAANAQRSDQQTYDPQLPALTRYLWNESMQAAWGQNLLPGGYDYLNNTHAQDRQVALFGDATLAVTETLKFTAGLRYAWTHFEFDNLNNGPQDLLNNGGNPARASGKKDETPITPKFTLSYQGTPDDLVFGTISKGYRSGGASPPLPVEACGGNFPTSYNSDMTWSYELGAKDKFLDRKLQISTSAFYVEWNNIQQVVVVPQCGLQYTTNVGDAISEGFDLRAQWQVADGLAVDLAAGYNDVKYAQNVRDPTHQGGLLAHKGDSIDVTPWTVAVGAQYDFLVDDHAAFVRADYEFTSHRHRRTPEEDPATQFYDPALRTDSATRFMSLRAGMTVSRWEFSVFVDNLFDAHPRQNLAREDQSTLLFTAETFRPRTAGIAASYRY